MLGRVLGPSQCGSPRGRPVNKQLGIKEVRKDNKTTSSTCTPPAADRRGHNYQKGYNKSQGFHTTRPGRPPPGLQQESYH